MVSQFLREMYGNIANAWHKKSGNAACTVLETKKLLIFFYIICISRGSSLFSRNRLRLVMRTVRYARRGILRKSRAIVRSRFEEKKKKKKKGKSTIILYFGVNVNGSARESSSTV